MNAIYTSASEIQKSWLPSVRVLGDLRAGVITYRNVIREHMLSELLEEKLAQEKTLETVVEANTNARKLYESMITSPEERALYNEWAQVWDEYRKGAAEVMALSRKAAGSYPREAHDLNTMTVNLIGIKADGILRKDIDLNNKGADTAGQDANDGYQAALGMVVIALGLAVLMALRRPLPDPRCDERHRLDRRADEVARRRRPRRCRPASGREDRNRHHGRHPAGVQGRPDCQEGC
jgi:methyl-accepting chemotaxis protein